MFKVIVELKFISKLNPVQVAAEFCSDVLTLKNTGRFISPTNKVSTDIGVIGLRCVFKLTDGVPELIGFIVFIKISKCLF